MDCPCVKSHSPKPSYLQIHHILPTSWGGPNTAANKIAVCGTTHDAIHDLLNKMVKANKTSTGVNSRGYPRLAVQLATRAWDEYLERNNGAPPTKYTLNHPE